MEAAQRHSCLVHTCYVHLELLRCVKPDARMMNKEREMQCVRMPESCGHVVCLRRAPIHRTL